MQTRTLKKLALALTFWLALHTTTLRAQIFMPSTNTSLDSGAGTRMFWYPGKAAIRAGGVDGAEWDDPNIGPYSVAMGYATTASGPYSVAFGLYTTASGYGSTALGDNSIAIGLMSTAIGWSTSSGYLSTSFGNVTLAYGDESTAFGEGTTAYGNVSTASGSYTYATAYNSFVIGTYNVGGGNPTSWVATDPLFEIGNGTWSAPHDALLVDKSGDVTAEGTIRCSPGGDLSMGTFTAGTHP